MGKYCLLSNQQEIEQFVQYYKRHPYAGERSKSSELFIYIFLGLDFITKINCKGWLVFCFRIVIRVCGPFGLCWYCYVFYRIYLPSHCRSPEIKINRCFNVQVYSYGNTFCHQFLMWFRIILKDFKHYGDFFPLK